jgi:hypothetical protein
MMDMTTASADDQFRELHDLALNDLRILGLYVGGSRTKGFQTLASDYDCYVIATDQAASDLAHLERQSSTMDVRVFSLAQFRSHAAIGSPEAWDRYNFAHGSAVIDKSEGEIQALIEEEGTLPAEAAAADARSALDAYINAAYRSMKNRRDGHQLASHLDAAESMSYLLEAMFSMQGRLRPYNKYLLWELKEHPVEDLPTGHPMSFAAAIKVVVARGDMEAQRRLFAAMEQMAEHRGFSDVFGAWGPALEPLRQ